MSKRIVLGADGKPVKEMPRVDKPAINAAFTLSIRKKPDSTATASQQQSVKPVIPVEQQGINWDTPEQPPVKIPEPLVPKQAEPAVTSAYDSRKMPVPLPPPPPAMKKTSDPNEINLIGLKVNMSIYETARPAIPAPQLQHPSQTAPLTNLFAPPLQGMQAPVGGMPGHFISQPSQQITIPQPLNSEQGLFNQPLPKIEHEMNPAAQAIPTIYEEPILNEDWFNHIYDNRLRWENYQNFPQEVLVMLSHLSTTYEAVPKTSSESVNSKQRSCSVSEPQSLTKHIESYKGNQKLKDNLEQRFKQFPAYREVRGDGNCFYRAFICSFLEMALRHDTACYFLRLVFDFLRIKGSIKTDCQAPEMLSHKDYFHYLMHRLLQLFSYRVELARDRDRQAKQKITKMFYAMLNSKPFQFDMYLVIAIKAYTLILVKKGNYEAIVGEELLYDALDNIPKYGIECNQNEICIQSLANGFKINLTLFKQESSLVRDQSYSPDGFRTGENLSVFFRTGHYDIIYSRQVCSSCYPNFL